MADCFWKDRTANVFEGCFARQWTFLSAFEENDSSPPGGQQQGYANGALGSDGFNGMQLWEQTMAIDGDTAAIGSRYTLNAFVQEGAVMVYEKSGGVWSTKTVLYPGYDRGNFGSAVAIDGDYMAINAKDSDADGRGSISGGCTNVYFRSGGTWALQQEIIPPGVRDYSFHSSCDIMDPYLILGTTEADPGGLASAGEASIYLRTGTTWALQETIVPSDTQASGQFGRSVAFTNRDGTDTAFIAAANSNDPVFGESLGAVYVFTRAGTTWTEDQKIVTILQERGQDFWGTVIAEGNTMMCNSSHGTHVFLWDGAEYVEHTILSNTGVHPINLWARGISADEQTITGGGWFEGEYKLLTWSAAEDYALIGAQPVEVPGSDTLELYATFQAAQSGDDLFISLWLDGTTQTVVKNKTNFFSRIG